MAEERDNEQSTETGSNNQQQPIGQQGQQPTGQQGQQTASRSAKRIWPGAPAADRQPGQRRKLRRPKLEWPGAVEWQQRRNDDR